MENSQNSTREKPELAFLNDAKGFFTNAEHTCNNSYPKVSVKKCLDFFQYVEPIVKEIWTISMIDTDTILDDVKQFFDKAQKIIAEVLFPETLSLNECQALFINAERIIQPTPPQVTIKKFQEFCEIARPSILKEYRRWMEFVEKNNIGGFKKINLFKVFGVSGKEEAHSKFLVWLMKEEESHGLGNIFIKGFMNTVAERYSRTNNLSSEGAIIIPEASGEHGVPDIKIKGKDFLCIVENKIRAMEGKDQTKRYADDASKEIENMKIDKEKLFLIFLTPFGRSPLDKRFKTMDYKEIIRLLREILKFRQNIDDSTKFLIEQFIFNLEMEILHIFDLEKSVENCLVQYSKRRENYLWESYETIYTIYDELIKRRVKNGRLYGFQ
jgi:hypothetical protein